MSLKRLKRNIGNNFNTQQVVKQIAMFVVYQCLIYLLSNGHEDKNAAPATLLDLLPTVGNNSDVGVKTLKEMRSQK